MKPNRFPPFATALSRRPARFPTVWAWLVLGVLVSWGRLAPAQPVNPPAPASELTRVGEVYQATLPNGFTLLVKPDRRAPTAVHMLWLRVGSMDETSGTTGIAHVLEHLMFKGTPTVKPGEYSRRVAALGGRDNAFTSRDVTAYHVQVPAHQLQEVMRLEADRFANNQWSDDEFRRELEVIKEERRQRVDDQPRAVLFEALNATAWQVHPYRNPVIGWAADLNALTPDEVRAFQRRWYVPANAAVVVAGDVDPTQVLTWAKQHYGPIPAGAVPTRKPQTEPPQTGMRQVRVKAPAEQAYVALAYPVPRLTDPDAADAQSQDALALVMLAAVLNGHEGARLGRALVQRSAGERLADAAGAGYSGMGRGPAQFYLDGTPAPGQDPVAVAAALQAEVARVARDGVQDSELQRVKNQWRAAEVYKLDALFAQARELGSQWANGWGPDASARLLASLGRITPAQVQAVAQRHFHADQLTQAVLLPDAQALAQRRAATGSNQPRLDIRH
ncbi:MAG: peptidase M16 [Polaromonas sp.]|nr:peptidase M16 [Polaromonas sp.]